MQLRTALCLATAFVVAVLAVACGGSNGGGSGGTDGGEQVTVADVCTAEVVAALDLTIDTVGDQAAYSAGATEVATTLGIDSTEYKIWRDLNAMLVSETVRQGRAAAKQNARTRARAECERAYP